MASSEDREAENHTPRQSPTITPERKNENVAPENEDQSNDPNESEVNKDLPEPNYSPYRIDKTVSDDNLNLELNNEVMPIISNGGGHQNSTSNEIQQNSFVQLLEPSILLTSCTHQTIFAQHVSQIEIHEVVYGYESDTIDAPYYQNFGIPVYQVAPPENYCVATTLAHAFQSYPWFFGYSAFHINPYPCYIPDLLVCNTHGNTAYEYMLGNPFFFQSQTYAEGWISGVSEDIYYFPANTFQNFMPMPYLFQQGNIVNQPCAYSNRRRRSAMRRSISENQDNLHQPSGSANNSSQHNPNEFEFVIPNLPAPYRRSAIYPKIRPEGYRTIKRGSEEDIYYKNMPALLHSYYMKTLTELVDKYVITMLTPGRPGKKLLVLDMDFTLSDFSSDYNPLCSGRPYLYSFMTSAYADYDIAIWSATDMKMIRSKLIMLGLENNPNFKISFLLDVDATMKCMHSSGRILIKPLELIWRKFDYYTKENTIMIDDVQRNFLKNPNNGIVIKPYYKYSEGPLDAELLRMIAYLKRLARVEDVTTKNHLYWDR